jgi:lysyl-tRNA synthetase class 2
MSGDERSRLLGIKPNLARRAKIFELTRSFFRGQGFIETDTPIRSPSVAPESEIEPFASEDWFLTTSPELYMKRLLAAGYDKIFQLIHCFRKGEQGRHHNPEFTLLEWYRIGADYMQMVSDTEQLVMSIAAGLGTAPVIHYKNQAIDISPPWRRFTVRDAFVSAAGWDPISELQSLRFDLDLVTKVVPSFAPEKPTVLLDYPAAMASLARLKADDSRVAERAEIFIGGLELANAYSELTDVEEQRKRFQAEMEKILSEKKHKATMPSKFLEAMACLPACGGIALGMDRLVMLFCNADSVAEVMAFTEDTA